MKVKLTAILPFIGSILSADILLVEGNPAENISDSRNVRHVFLRGNQVDRSSLKVKN